MSIEICYATDSGVFMSLQLVACVMTAKNSIIVAPDHFRSISIQKDHRHNIMLEDSTV